MPAYLYRCDAGHEVLHEHAMSAPAIEACTASLVRWVPRAGTVIGDNLVYACGAPTRIVVTKAAAISHRRFDKATGYQAHLAAFPGDPSAFTDGPRSKQALLDRRMREGWRRVPDVASDARRPRAAPRSGPTLEQRVKAQVVDAYKQGRLLEPRPESPDAPPEAAEEPGPDEQEVDGGSPDR